MVESIHRPTKLIIDLQAIKTNIQHELQANPGKDIFVAVKANGYGHGAVETAKAALEAGVTGLCVATLDEGIELREQGITAPILLLGLLSVELVGLAQHYHMAVPVSTCEWLQQMPIYLNHEEAPLSIHLAVDTGMGRIGFTDEGEIVRAVQLLEQTENVVWEGIFTHFATADQAESSYWEKQNHRFQTVIAQLPYLPKYVHISNSATSLWHENLGNVIRMGIAMYGLNPSGTELTTPYPLAPALSLVSELVQVKKVAPGEGIGYGMTYVTTEEEWIGTVPIGYADGYMRCMQGFYVLVEGQRCEIVGRVCMDQLMIRLPQDFPVGSKVTLIGQNQGAEITMQAVADHAQTIHYEISCLFSQRIPREYI